MPPLAPDTIAITASDGNGGEAVPRSVELDVNASPAIAVPGAQVLQQGVAQALTGITISDADSLAGESYTVILSDTSGLLTASTGPGGGGTITGAGTTMLTLSGTLAEVNADLATLSVSEATLATDSIAITASDGNGGEAVPRSVELDVNASPAIAVPGAQLLQQGVAQALAGITVSDADSLAGESYTVILSDTSGLLAASTGVAGGGGTITGTGTTMLTLSGTLAEVNADLTTLSVSEATLATDSISITASDGNGGEAVPRSIELDVNASPAIAVPGAQLLQQGVAQALGGITIADADSLAGESYTVMLSDTSGLLTASAGPGGGGSITGSGTTSLTISGTLAQVNADLATLSISDSTLATDAIAITASDNKDGTASPKSIELDINAKPIIAAPPAINLDQGVSAAIPGVTISDADALSGETYTVTLADVAGLLSANTGAGGGGTVTGSGTTSLTITGTLAQVNADLTTLSIADSALAGNSISLTAIDNKGGTAAPLSIAVAVTGSAGPPPTVTIDTVNASNVVDERPIVLPQRGRGGYAKPPGPVITQAESGRGRAFGHGQRSCTPRHLRGDTDRWQRRLCLRRDRRRHRHALDGDHPRRRRSRPPGRHCHSPGAGHRPARHRFAAGAAHHHGGERGDGGAVRDERNNWRKPAPRRRWQLGGRSDVCRRHRGHARTRCRGCLQRHRRRFRQGRCHRPAEPRLRRPGHRWKRPVVHRGCERHQRHPHHRHGALGTGQHHAARQLHGLEFRRKQRRPRRHAGHHATAPVRLSGGAPVSRPPNAATGSAATAATAGCRPAFP